jgi:hypothetical protein
MSNELPKILPLVLGFAVGVLVWAILCARARRQKGKP